MRAWARDNGYVVADRGRLPAEVTDAYLAAGTKPAKPAKKAAAKPAPARKAAPKRAAAKVVAAAPVEPVALEAPEAPVEADSPRPKPSVVNDDRRLVALGEELAALAKRVEALEQAAGSKGTSGKARFRRRS